MWRGLWVDRLSQMQPDLLTMAVSLTFVLLVVGGWPQIVAGLALMFVLPGMVLTHLLFPHGDLTVSERAAIAISLSVPITPVLAFVLVSLPGHFGNDTLALALATALFLMIGLLITYLRDQGPAKLRVNRHVNVTYMWNWLSGRSAIVFGGAMLASFLVGVRYIDGSNLNSFLYPSLIRSQAAQFTGERSTLIFSLGDYFPFRFISDFLPYAGMSLTDLDPIKWATLPVGAILLPLMYFAVSHAVTRNALIAASVATAAGLNHSLLSVHTATNSYVFAHVLFLGFLLINYRLACRGRATREEIITICLLFVAQLALHQTATLWMIVMTTVSIILLSFVYKRGTSTSHRFDLLLLPLGLIVTYLSFEAVFDRVLFQVGHSDLRQALDPFATRLFGLVTIGGGTLDLLPPFRVPPPGDRIQGLSSFVWIVLVVAPWIPYGFSLVRRVVTGRRRDSRSMGLDIIIVAAVTTLVVQVLGYLLYGAVSLRFIFVVFPILTSLILLNLRLPTRLVQIWAAGLVLVTAIGIASFLSDAPETRTYQDTRVAAAWISENTASRDPILADLDIYGVIMFEAAISNGKTVTWLPFTSKRYAALLGVTPLAGGGGVFPQEPRYIVLSQRSEHHIAGNDWEWYESASNHFAEIQQNPNLVLRYEDEYVLIYENQLFAPQR